MDFKHILCLPILLLLFPIVYGLKILKNSKTNICPNGNGPEWSNMASMVDRKYCSEEEKYHCIQTQIGNYTELCIKPIRIDKGYHPEYSEAVKRLYPRQCSNDYFQENDMWSDEFRTVTCSMMKSSCDGEGEYRCHNGSPTSNRECGCNHTAGYRVQQFYAEYLKQTCFNPLYQHGDCIYLPCEKKHEELNEVYECVPKRGYNSPPPTKPTSETSSVPALMTKDLDKTGISVAKQPLKDHSIDVLYIAVPLSCVGVLLIVIVGLYFICRGKPMCSGNDIKCCINIQGGDIQFGEKNTMENNMQLEPLLPADDDHNERNEQRTPVHIDHSVPPSPCQEDGTLRSMKDTIDMFTARIRPEFHIPPDIDKYLTPSHGLYFSLLYLLKIYYREKFSSIRSAFEFYKKVSLYLDLNEFPKLTLDGFVYKSAENEKFACEKIVREISDKYQVPITVISVLDSDNIQKTQCFTSHPSNQSSSAMPCIYLGCLENEAKSFFFVPLISSSSDTEEDGSSLDYTNIGECLKKEEDDVDNYSNYVNLLKANVSDSIAFIKVTGSGTGSGYQVGPRYVVTALHVVKDVFRNMWRTIFQELKGKNEEMLKSPTFPIKIKLDKWEEYQQSFDLSVFVEDGVWPLGYLKVENVIKYLKDNNKCKLADKIKKQAKNIIFDCQVEFGKIDTEQRKPYHIHFDMAYGNSEEDIAVLELDENTDKIPFRRFLMLSLKKTINKVHVLGHPAGKVLQFDPSCSVVENGNELCSLQNDAIDFFTGSKFTPALDKDMQEDVKKEYKAMSLQHKDMFMQCSKSFAKGSSGGPCLIYDETRKAPVVVGTILRGIPYIYFNGFNEKQQEKSKQQPRFLLDKALTSWGLYELLEKIPKLQDEIYKEKDATTVDSDPIQAPEGPLEISEVKKGSVKLSWKKVPSNDTVKQYIIQRVECTKQEGSVPLNWDDCGVVPVENISKEDYCCVVNDLDEEREYLFRVFAKNSDNESGLYLQSIDGVIPKDPIPPPSMPNGPLNIEAKTQNSVILSWQQECTSCEYHIQMKTGDSEDWLNIDKTKNPPVEIPDIDPKKSSFFQIYAQNDGGRSEPLGCDENFNLKDLYLPPCFQGELQTTLRGDKAELKWNPLQEQPFYPVTEYEIYAYHAETKEHLTTVSPENITAYKTKRLNKGTEYVFSISAKNDIGLGKELKSKEVFIQGVPDPPVRTKDPILEGTSIDIGWGAPVDNGGSPVTEYVVYSQCLNLGADRYQKEGTSWEEITTLDANTLRFVYENFQIPSKCMLQIIAKNVVGESYPLELGPVDVIQKGIPGPPVWTKHPVVKGGTLEIEWGPPSDDGGSPIEEYVVYMMKLDEDFQEEEAIGLIEWEEKARCNSETLKWNTNNIKTSFKFKLKVVAKTSMGESEPLHLEPVDI